MLVAGFPAQAFGTNCYVVAPGPGEQCVVVDPGIGVVDALDKVLAEHRLQPVAVLLTHGHLDHTFSVTPVCGARGATAYIHPADRELLADPAKGLSADMTALFGGRLPWTEPDDVAELPDGGAITISGLEISVDHAPGHTGGSVMFRLPGSCRPAHRSCGGGGGVGSSMCLVRRIRTPGGTGPTAADGRGAQDKQPSRRPA